MSSRLYRALKKLATNEPSLRRHLVPLLKQGSRRRKSAASNDYRLTRKEQEGMSMLLAGAQTRSKPEDASDVILGALDATFYSIKPPTIRDLEVEYNGGGELLTQASISISWRDLIVQTAKNAQGEGVRVDPRMLDEVIKKYLGRQVRSFWTESAGDVLNEVSEKVFLEAFEKFDLYEVVDDVFDVDEDINYVDFLSLDKKSLEIDDVDFDIRMGRELTAESIARISVTTDEDALDDASETAMNRNRQDLRERGEAMSLGRGERW